MFLGALGVPAMGFAQEVPTPPAGLVLVESYSSLPFRGIQCFQSGRQAPTLDIGHIAEIREYADPQTHFVRHIDYQVWGADWQSVDLSDQTSCDINVQN
jgi:hypothetical protein